MREFRFGPGAVFAIWFVTTTLLSGALAAVWGYSGVWGNSEGIFLEYMLPLPVATGLLHVPTQIVVGLMLALGVPRFSPSVLAGFRLSLLSLFAAGVAMSLNSGWVAYLHTDAYASTAGHPPFELDGNPLGLFVRVDAVVALALSFLPVRGAAQMSPVRVLPVALFGMLSLMLPLLALMLFQPHLLTGGPTLQYVSSFSPSRGHEVGFVFVRERPRTEEDWTALLTFAKQHFGPRPSLDALPSDVLFFHSRHAAIERRKDGVLATVCIDDRGNAELRSNGFAPCLDSATALMR
jgi:hypothetical protein